jgi:uncharacterized protein (DUF934 family)
MLLDCTGAIPDIYPQVQLGGLGGLTHALVVWGDLPEALAEKDSGTHLGVVVPNTVDLVHLRQFQAQLALIIIAFPSFSDGRGFSLARRMRHGGYRGILRAFGPLIADQFVQALACGFDEVHVPDAMSARQPLAQWLAALTSVNLSYQPVFSAQGNILQKRRAALVLRGEIQS